MIKGRSPLKNPPLRNPGEGLQEQLNDLLTDKIMLYLLIGVLPLCFTIQEWFDYFFSPVPRPFLLTILTIPCVIVAWVKIKKFFREGQNIARGMKAEKSVGQYLEQFRAQGYQIFHDIPGENGDKKFNTDHVIIGPKGVFTIETKYARKPEKGQTKIQYDGRQISINGQTPDRDPVVQAKAQASDLSTLLKESTGRVFFVKPVVIYPGWFVENKVFNAEVWVMNEKALGPFIERQDTELSDENISMASHHLSRHIQSTLK